MYGDQSHRILKAGYNQIFIQAPKKGLQSSVLFVKYKGY